VYWGAAINPVHAALLKKGSDFVKDVKDGVLLLGQCLAVNHKKYERILTHILRKVLVNL
jgi:hypothetical protein